MLTLHNGKFITCDPDNPYAQAVIIDQGHLIAVGSNDNILSISSKNNPKFDLEGQTVIPGITDAHIHVEDYAASLEIIDCETATLEECLDRARLAVQQSQPGRWIRGHGWNHNSWGGKLPTADQLDRVAPDNPVYLTGKSLHIAWFNHATMNAAHISGNTPDPAGGRIERDIHGSPSGILMDLAMDMIEDKIPLPSDAEYLQRFKRAQASLLKMGITSIHNFDSLRAYRTCEQLHATGELSLHVVEGIPGESLDLAIANHWKTGIGDDWLQFGPLKLFSDGALGSKTASMLQPYCGTVDEIGLEILSKDAICDIGEKALLHGIGLAIHAIGDRANRVVLDAFEHLRAFETTHGLNPQPFRIEHLQIIDPADIPRLKQLNVIASMQPTHATSDAAMADRYWGERCSHAYAWNSVLTAGAGLVFGSDAPVENPNPFWGIHAAVTRQQRGSADTGWYPEQCLSLQQALYAFTYAPVAITPSAGKWGVIKKYSYADLVVLSADPEKLPPDRLYNMKVNAVMVAGKWLVQ